MRIAVTGGIGSGKSYVCKIMSAFGIEIYDCDAGAKRLMSTSGELKRKLTALIGPETYVDGKFNKAVVAAFLLASEENKRAINNIVHPAVIDDFYASGLQWMECAILFDAHLESYVDKIVCVTAPHDVRVKRIMERDGITSDKANEWINAQMPQEEVERRSDFVIINDGKASLEEQVTAVVDYIKNKKQTNKKIN